MKIKNNEDIILNKNKKFLKKDKMNFTKVLFFWLFLSLNKLNDLRLLPWRSLQMGEGRSGGGVKKMIQPNVTVKK